MKDTPFKLKFRIFILIVCFMIPSITLADVAILIHGYHSSGNVWRHTNITRILANKGWNDAGSYTPNGNIPFYGQTLSHFLSDVPSSTNKGKYLVTAELPSEAPIEIQASLLSHYLRNIAQQFPQQKLHLIAHSAGGLVARLSLVNNFSQVFIQEQYSIQKRTTPPSFYTKIAQLITIASPHLGSPIADMAENASDTPIGFFAPFFGADEINRAEQLYKQLGQEDKNHFLFWLNRQPHPPMHYTSIIRANGSILKGDWLVPPQSQNMAYVPAIGIGAKIILTPGSHELKYADGFLLSKLLP